ncbi:MAG: hypothetical protein ABW170_06180 [Candidatus Thiodiazotropha sp. L084R]
MINYRISGTSLFIALLLSFNTGVASEKWKFVSAVSIFANKLECDNKIPGFKARTHHAYKAWLKHKKESVEGFDDNLLLAIKKKHSSLNKTTSDQELTQLKDNCQNIELSLKSFTLPPNSRRSSPEGTWKLYLTALSEGDRDLAISCLMGSARNNWAKMFEELSSTDMKELSETIKRSVCQMRYLQISE